MGMIVKLMIGATVCLGCSFVCNKVKHIFHKEYAQGTIFIVGPCDKKNVCAVKVRLDNGTYVSRAVPNPFPGLRVNIPID